jgi:hypothetical protein
VKPASGIERGRRIRTRGMIAIGPVTL